MFLIQEDQKLLNDLKYKLLSLINFFENLFFPILFKDVKNKILIFTD